MPFDDAITEPDIRLPEPLRTPGLQSAEQLVETDPRASAFSLMQAMRTDPTLSDLDGRTLVLLVKILRRRAKARS